MIQRLNGSLNDASEKKFQNGRGFIYKSELEFISRHTLDSPQCEIGGDLFGYWTYEGFPIIAYAIGPGEKANRQVAFFNQDEAYLATVGRRLNREHGLQHLGNWHSHHQLGLAEPSSHDSATVRRAIQTYGLSQFFLVITNVRQQLFEKTASINGFLYRAGAEAPIAIEWIVLESASPIRIAFDARHPALVIEPRTAVASYSDDLPLALIEESEEASFQDDYWLNKEDNQILLKAFLDELETRFSEASLLQEEDETVSVKFSASALQVCVNFPKGFPQCSPAIALNGIAIEQMPEWSGTLTREALLAFIANALKGAISTGDFKTTTEDSGSSNLNQPIGG